jgi:hypothetical protein
MILKMYQSTWNINIDYYDHFMEIIAVAVFLIF